MTRRAATSQLLTLATASLSFTIMSSALSSVNGFRAAFVHGPGSLISRGISHKLAISSNFCPLTLSSSSNMHHLPFRTMGRPVSPFREFSTTLRASAAEPEAPTEEEVDPGVVEGTDLRILKYPHPKLRAEDAEVTEFNDELKKIVKEMFLVMYASKGVGLAAPQVGINKQIMVFNPEGDKKKWLKEVALINPKIVAESEGTDVEVEACLSFPDMQGKVRRHKWIKVEAQDVKGKKIKKKYDGWEARVFQHEYDHLEGTVYIDRLDEEGRKEVQETLDQLVEQYKKDNGDDYAL